MKPCKSWAYTLTVIIGLVLGSVALAERLTTFAWAPAPGWPSGTTVELCSNGPTCLSGLTGLSATMSLPVNPGEVIQGMARAIPPLGSAYQISDWATVAQTWPALPVSGWARYQRQEVTPMAIAFVNANAAAAGGIESTTIASAALSATTGNALFVAISAYGGPNGVVTGVTDTAGNTYTRAGSEEGGDAFHKTSIWYALNITGNASNVVTATFAGVTPWRCISVAQFSGIATSGAYDQASTIRLTSGTTHTSNDTGTTTQNDELVIASYIAWSAAYSMTATAPTVIAAQVTDGNNAIAYKIVSSTGAQSTTVTTTSSTSYAVQARTFKADAGGAATALPRRAIDGPFYGALRGSVR